jgi:gliding motility-associated-like protein
VSAISVNGTSVYLGGNFSDVNGDSRNGLAAVDATTGNTLSWNAGVTINGEVKTLYATTNQLYIGGDFTDVNGLARNRVASFNLSTGSLLPWNPATGDLQDVVKIEANAKWVAVKNSSDEVTAFSSTSGIVNDNFTNISDFTLADDQLILGPSLSAYDLYNNDYTSWSPDVGSDPDGDPAVSAVAFAADKIIVGGYFDNMGFEGRTNLGAYLATIPSSLIQITTQPTDLTSCLGESITFTVAATGTTNLTYQWQFSTDGIVFTDLIDNDNYANTTTATLSVNTTNNIGAGHYRCQINGDLSLASFTNDITLAINALPSAPIASNQSSCLEASVTLSASGGTDGAYRWYTEATAGSNISGEVNSNYTTTILDETSIYYVSLINSLCESNRTPITITIGGSACVGSGELVVYNGISPNGDLYNEKWIIENIELSTETRENKVSIYNRWGSQVFEVADYNNDTNVFKGLNQNGGELPSGTYYYKIEFTNGQSSKTGYLVLKR